AMWLLLMTAHVFFTGVNLGRARITRGGAQALGAAIGLLLPLAALAAVGAQLMAMSRHTPLSSPGAVVAAVAAVGAAGPAALVSGAHSCWRHAHADLLRCSGCSPHGVQALPL